MFTIKENSNLLDVTSGIILHGCNAQGVMSSGVAKQLRAKYPEIYMDYINHLKFYETPGDALGSYAHTRVTNRLTIVSGITQEFYGRNPAIQYVSYEAIRNVLETVFSKVVLMNNITVHIPHLLGAGLGGGDYDIILSIFKELTLKYGVNVICHKV